MYKILAETLFLGKELIYVPSCHSTNDLALSKLAEPDTREGLIVITDHQIKGRGQRGNAWQSSPKMNLLFSIILKPNWLSPDKQFYLNIISSLAVKQTIEDFGILDRVQIKWPNDVLINKMKVAGILAENSIRKMSLENSVVGIGFNVHQMKFDLENATSLAKHSNIEFTLPKVLEKLVVNLERFYLLLKAQKYLDLKTEYLASLYGYLAQIRLKSEYEFMGKIVDVSDSGILKVEANGKIMEFNFKEVEFIL